MTDRSSDVIRSMQTIREMLADRAKHDDLWDSEIIASITEDELRSKMQNSSAILVFQLENNVRIVYMLQSKFKVLDVRRLISTGKLSSEDVVIFVTVEGATGAHFETLKGLFARVQIFKLDEILVNITKHALQPKSFQVLSDGEVAAALEAREIKSKMELPRILSSDSVAKYYALKTGQVLRIVRRSPSAGESVVFRMCA
jgi:DNA-directed RNA polymerase I, II, and III subunit RPABC1